MLPRHILFLVVCIMVQGLVSTNSNFSDTNLVLNITKDSLDDIASKNKSAMILFFSERHVNPIITTFYSIFVIIIRFMLFKSPHLQKLTIYVPQSFFCITSLRCKECDNLRLELNKLPKKLKEAGLTNIFVGEADCCKEYEFCTSSDRKTKCLTDEMNQGIEMTIIKIRQKSFIGFSLVDYNV